MSFELIVSEIQPQEILIKNKEELKKELAANLEKYNKVLTEETVKEGSSDRAKLNKLIDAIETKRKEIKNSCLEPYNNIEKDFKQYLYEMYKRNFERNIFDISMVINYFEMLEIEKKNIITIIEGIRYKLPAKEINSKIII